MTKSATALIPIVTGMDSTRLLLVNRVTLPSRAARVVEVRGEFTGVTCRLLNEMGVVEGVLHEQVYYLEAGGAVRSVCESVPFGDFLDLPWVQSFMECRVEPEIESVTGVLVGSLTVEVHTLIPLRIIALDKHPAPISPKFRPV